MNREQFLQALGERTAEREKLRASFWDVQRAMRVQKKHVELVSDIVVPGFAWIASFVAAIWMWRWLDARLLVDILAAHVIFRSVARVYINAIWIPGMFRALGRRFPEFRSEIDAVLEQERGGDDD